ncbi:MAG TPA: efflux RND transporter periplasmic adaptor subunit [Isosphaeraceae bacterium]|jgi:RND family efflux transporter MFP subunit|nr:efflux RND transporter periplasmic adaptor subunit [Isosphaeraceae bacterium]
MSWASSIIGGRPARARLAWAGLAAGAIATVVLAVTLSHDRLFHGNTLLAAPAAPEAKPAAAAAPTTVELTAEKIKAAGLRTEPVKAMALPTVVSVPGTIEVNVDRRVAIRPRVAGIIREVHVILGQKVEAGEPLVTLDSADLGTARLNLRARQLELATARRDAEFKATVAANVAELLKALEKGAPAAQLEKQFADKDLGSRRSELLSAYADLGVASHEETIAARLVQNNVYGPHKAEVTMHVREGKQATFEGIRDQVRFDVRQQKLLADEQVVRAEAAVIDAAQRLRILGAPVGKVDLNAEAKNPTAAEDVTAYTIVAPFDGTITARAAVLSQRSEPADATPLFMLADLDTVRVVAHVYESDFAALPGGPGEPLRLTSAAFPGRTFEAKVIDVGKEVEPTSRTVRLLGEAPNPEGKLRPNMPVRVEFDGPADAPSPTVPAAAVVEIDGKAGVFLPEKDGRHFTFHPVKPGRESAGRRAVLSGLADGRPVVADGAFVLKSELILQNEPEEE